MISIYVIIVTKYLSVLPNINNCCIIQMNGYNIRYYIYSLDYIYIALEHIEL